jgi:mutator protein MutT
MGTIPLVAFIVLKNTAFLAEVRKKTDDLGAGKIWIPGGHVEPSESVEQAFKRELFEELGIIPTRYTFLCKLPWENKGKQYNIHYFLCTVWSGELKNNEAEKTIWINPSEVNKLSEDVDRIAIQKYFEGSAK